MKRLLALTMFCTVAVAPAAEANLVRNGSFEAGADRDGAPDEWRASGDSRLVAQKLSVDKGRDGSRCAKLECTRFAAENPACHAMLCQMDVPVRRGMGYRLTLWAKGKDIAAETVAIAISDTRAWSNCGLNGAFAPTPEWRPYEFVFRASRDCPKGSRLQMWFGSTGTLWADDVVMVEAGRDLYRPGSVIRRLPGAKNLVPNGGFECGTDGWGSAEWDRTRHWGGPMNRLFGQLDTKEAHQGRASLRIKLTPENQPVSYFDYYDLYRQPIRAPLAGNVGFIEVEPGKPYVLSAWMKAAAANTPARLAVRQFERGSFHKAVRVGTDWRRYVLPFKPTARWCYVLAGPDLFEARDNPRPPDRATVWLDAVQLEQAPAPTDFAARAPVELGIATDHEGNVFGWDEPVEFRLAVAGSGLKRSARATVRLRLTDFFDKEVWQEAVSVEIPARGGMVWKTVEPPRSDRLRGYLKLHAVLTCGDVTAGRSMRLAVIPVHSGGDSRFGVNHAYPWPHLLDLSRKAGLVWVRDWSLKWQTVEPEKGRFDFAETDFQIDRPLKHGLKVLGLLPFPSSNWASTAPASVRKGTRYEARRAVVAYAPRDEAEFESYVARTVAHYRGRVRWWQVFNEPLFTSYSLPRAKGYGGKDYARWTAAFARAARKADPDCRVLAGIGYLGEGQIMNDFEQFFAAGGLKACDAVDIHHYPRLRPPEFAGKLLDQLNALMDKHGGRKPIWLTEYGYYADDEPWARPMPNNGFNQPLASEELQAAYAVRWAAIMFSRGVDKVFYHAGTCDGIDRDSLQGIFYEYAGTPHKIYAAQAVMAHLLTPECKPAGQLELGEGVHGHLFRDGRKLVAVVWSVAGAKPKPVRLAEAKLRLMDLMGRPLAARELTPSGTPVYVLGEGLTEEAFRSGMKP